MNEFLIALVVVILTGPVAGCITWINCLFMAMISVYLDLDKPTNMYYLYTRGREENPVRDSSYFQYLMFPILGAIFTVATEVFLIICLLYLIYYKVDPNHKFVNWVCKVWNKFIYPFTAIWKKLKISIYNILCRIEIKGINNGNS